VTASEIYFNIEVDYSTRRIAIHGELDAATAVCLDTAIARFQRVAPGEITVALDDVTFIDDVGLGAVVKASSTQQACGDGLVVTGASAHVRHIFKLGGAAHLLQHR
jgi:anti-anti-sigma factor